MRRNPAALRTVLERAAAVAAAAVLMAALAAPASADTAPDPEGWLRLAHLSPDTPEVDIRLTNVATAKTEEYTGVGYADVSGYERLEPGSYTVAMRQAGAPADSEPVISAAVEIEPGVAYTVAAFGLQEDLTAKIITDDLQAPAAGTARVRLIQASVSSDSVDVVTDSGDEIATDVPFASVTGYADVDAGAWNLEVSGGGNEGVAQVDLAPGSNNTLFAIDQDGALTIAAVEDSSGTRVMPQGGVLTGSGGLYYAEQRQRELLLGALAVLVPAAVVLLMATRRRGAAPQRSA